MADSLPLDMATMAGCFTAAILYGMLTILLIGALYVLFHKRRAAPRPNYVLVTSALLMFLLNTVILALSYSRIQDAFFFNADVPGGALADLEQINQWKEVTRTSLTLALAIVGDATLIYRCWVVWGKRILVIIVPVVLLVVFVGMSILPHPRAILTAVPVVDILLSYSMVNLGDGSTMFVSRVRSWITAALSMTLVQNSLVTSLIVYKIWTIDIRASHHRSQSGRSLRPVIAVVLESGLIYVTTILVFLVVYVSDSNAQYIMVDALNPVIGITFYLLIVRVGLRRHDTQTTRGISTSMGQSSPGALPAQAITVKVEREEFDEESGLELRVVGSGAEYEGKGVV